MSGTIPRGQATRTGTASSVQLMLYVAAVLQVVAAGVTLMLIPISGMRKFWLLICAALVIQAYRRVDAVATNAGMLEAVTALAVSALLLAGIIGFRTVFVMLRRNRSLIDDEVRRTDVVVN